MADSAELAMDPAESEWNSRHENLPPKPRYRATSGLTKDNGKDYTIIKKVEHMNGTRSRSSSIGPNGRSNSRTKHYIDKGEETSRMKDTNSSEHDKRSSSRQRSESRGPIGFLSRGRSKTRRDGDDSEPKEEGVRSRSRSRMGKGIMKKMRSLSRRRKSSPESPRERSSERRLYPQRGFEHLMIPDERGRRRTASKNHGNSRASEMPPRPSQIPPRPDSRRTGVSEKSDVENTDTAQAAERVRSPYSSPDENHENQDSEEDQNEEQKRDTQDADDTDESDESAEFINKTEDTRNENEINISDEQSPVYDHHGPERESMLQSDSESESEEEEEEEEEENGMTEADVMNLDKKNTQMHVACLLHYSSKDIVAQLKLDKTLAFKANSAGELPLHYAMMDKKGVNDEVLLTLLNLNPDAVQYPNSHRSLPIHLACLSGGAKIDAIRALVSMCPDSVMVRSRFPIPFEPDMLDNVDTNDSESEEGQVEKQPQTTPSSGSFFDYFSSQTPPPPPPPSSTSDRKKPKKKGCVDDALTKGKQMYETGWTPLHLAIINGADSEVIELLVSANPHCVFVKTNRGRMPIDCAQYMVRQHWLYGTDDETTVQKTFAAIELLEETAIDNR